MKEPEWLDIAVVLDFHSEQLSLFGGADGVRDLGLLESALARPINKFADGETDLAPLAVTYGFGAARNHAFIGGNKRTAPASMIVLLGLNGMDLDAPQDAATAVVLSLGAGEITEEALAGWIADHIVPLEAPAIVP